MHTPLDENAFAGVFRAGDSRRFGLDLKKDRATIIAAAKATAHIGFSVYSPIYITTANGRPCSSVKDYSQTLILRILAKFIARRFRVSIDSRERMVRGVIEALADSTPLYIVRRDMSSFYETLPLGDLIRRLTYDIFIPTILRQHLNCFFQTFCPAGAVGLPRGICMSPILAELGMEIFDKKVQSLPGVYKYFRYSDDILIFSYLPTDKIEAELPNILPSGMKFNKSKSFSTSLNCDKKPNQAIHSIEYLGYSYTVSDLCGEKEPRRVEVAIAERKISKLKTRIFRCFKAHEKDKLFDLLRDRLQFLSSNYVVHRHGVTAIKSSKLVKSGIYYNYRLCGMYSKGEVKPHFGRELKALDGFYQALIKPGTNIGSKLTAAQYSDLRRISFFKGYELKHTTRFAPDRVAALKRVWKNA